MNQETFILLIINNIIILSCTFLIIFWPRKNFFNDDAFNEFKKYRTKIWFDKDKNSWYFEGDGQAIAMILRKTGAQRIVIDGEVFDIIDATRQIAEKINVKFKFNKLL